MPDSYYTEKLRGTPTECGISVDSVIVSSLCSQAKAAPKHRKSVTKRSGVALFLCSSRVPCDSVTPTIDIEPIEIEKAAGRKRPAAPYSRILLYGVDYLISTVAPASVS